MRPLMIAALIALCRADVSELPGSGYNYYKPTESEVFRGLGVGSQLGPGIIGAASRPGFVGGSDNGFSAGGQRPVTVSKRFFTFTAQDTNDDDDDDSYESRGGGHKHYDIVFAHAPSPSIKSILKGFQRYAAEHQTAVYVLSQKLGAAEIGKALRASGIKPSKPQVHFIKYKTPEEAAYAQRQIRARYDALGGSTHDGGEASSPVRSVIGSLGRRLEGGSSFGPYGNYGEHGSYGNYGFKGVESLPLGNRYLPPNY